MSFVQKKRMRKNFGNLADIAEIPSLLDMQKDSYRLFLEQTAEGTETFYTLDGAFKSIFP